MRRHLPVILVGLVNLSRLSLAAQEPAATYRFVQVLLHSGVYWSRTEYLADQFKEGYRALEFRYGVQSAGQKTWHQYNNFPRYGWGIHYADLVADREDTIVGNPLSAFLFYGAPRVRFGRLAVNTDLSLGLSYASRIHDPLLNPFNDVIASHINLYFDFNLNLSLRLSDRMDLHGGYGVTHYSNGRIHQPQKGVNNWGWNFGLSYHFARREGDEGIRPHFIYREPEPCQSYGELQIMGAAGAVEHQRLGDLEGQHYLTSSATVDYAFHFHRRMAVTMGIDMLYDGSLELDIKGEEPEDVTLFQKGYLGSHMGYQFYVDRLTFFGNLGTYFFQHSNDRGYWFIRAGGRFRMTPHLHLQICIKTKNGIRADWIEWGIVYARNLNIPVPGS